MMNMEEIWVCLYKTLIPYMPIQKKINEENSRGLLRFPDKVK